MNAKLTDIHQHLLWGVDDGARTAEAMQKMLRKAAKQGIARIAATPHALPGHYPFDLGKYRERLAEAQEYCRSSDLPIEILPGAEVAWTYQTVDVLRKGAVPTLGGTDYVLLELSGDITIPRARDAVRSMMAAGYCPVLAHVERCRCFCWSPREAIRFHDETGAIFQMNASTILEPRGLMEKHFVHVMLEEECIDAIATDAHGRVERPINLRAAFRWLCENVDEDYAVQLTSFFGEIQ